MSLWRYRLHSQSRRYRQIFCGPFPSASLPHASCFSTRCRQDRFIYLVSSGLSGLWIEQTCRPNNLSTTGALSAMHSTLGLLVVRLPIASHALRRRAPSHSRLRLHDNGQLRLPDPLPAYAKVRCSPHAVLDPNAAGSRSLVSCSHPMTLEINAGYRARSATESRIRRAPSCASGRLHTCRRSAEWWRATHRRPAGNLWERNRGA